MPVLRAERHARAQPEAGCGAAGPRLRGEQVVERGIRGERAGGTTHPLLQSPTSLPDAERPALQDRPGDQSVGSGCHEQVRDRVGARRLPEDRHPPGVAAEPADARTHPAQRLDEIEQAEVRRTPARFAVAEEPEHAEPIRHGDDDDPLLAHECGRIVAADVARARHVGAAVHPHHDREGFAGPVRRARDRESQAVLVELDAAHRAAEEAVARGGGLGASESLVLPSGCLVRVGIDRNRWREALGPGVADVADPRDLAVVDGRENAEWRRHGGQVAGDQRPRPDARRHRGARRSRRARSSDPPPALHRRFRVRPVAELDAVEALVSK